VAQSRADLAQGRHFDLILAMHEGQWSRALQIYDAHVLHAPVLASGTSGTSHRDLKRGLAKSVQRLGCHHLLQTYLADQEGADDAELQLEGAWRTSSWVRNLFISLLSLLVLVVNVDCLAGPVVKAPRARAQHQSRGAGDIPAQSVPSTPWLVPDKSGQGS
jgi:hypothetical protein